MDEISFACYLDVIFLNLLLLVMLLYLNSDRSYNLSEKFLLVLNIIMVLFLIEMSALKFFIAMSKLLYYGNMSNLTKNPFPSWIILAIVLLDMAMELEYGTSPIGLANSVYSSQ